MARYHLRRRNIRCRSPLSLLLVLFSLSLPTTLAQSTLEAIPSPTPTDSDSNSTSDPYDPHAFNYYFLIVAAAVIIFCAGALFLSRRKRRKILRRRESSHEALRQDVAGWRLRYRLRRRGSGSGVDLDMEGLNERGEAPPSYQKAIGDNVVDVGAVRSESEVGTGQPPGYVAGERDIVGARLTTVVESTEHAEHTEHEEEDIGDMRRSTPLATPQESVVVS